ncbi:conserved protein of unknown function [Magnetospirillum sp. XM-1]|uniref:DUF6362 family protein n=1 Tax=Magnetospirillum sp. XM-1 TaxID=1663591 RepID=UPI00073DC6E0|nr:DUF6362 family protein [Magnetospirillum sp. XM-1]CUW37105.1 conserved protein of unknown function [Magnetospirillum sp. XM-1]
MDDLHWAPKMVAVYLEEAAETLRRLPRVKVQGYVTAWPEIVRDYWDAFGRDEVQVRPGPPSAKAIDQMDVTLGWLRWLEIEESRLVWHRACGRPWKAIAHEFGCDRTTAWRRWTYALVTIAARLNTPQRGGSPCNTVATSWGATYRAKSGRVSP